MSKAPKISESHRKELLRFLLEKTAAVRVGVKPGELLRVRHCYERENAEGLRYCLYRRDVYETLGLDFIELLREKESSLVLFYNRDVMERALACPDNASILASCGYSINANAAELLSELASRFAKYGICHEIGVFIGYPAKDVRGFIERLEPSPAHGTPWRVFGDVAESIRVASVYKGVEDFAHGALDAAATISGFFDLCARWRASAV